MFIVNINLSKAQEQLINTVNEKVTVSIGQASSSYPELY